MNCRSGNQEATNCNISRISSGRVICVETVVFLRFLLWFCRCAAFRFLRWARLAFFFCRFVDGVALRFLLPPFPFVTPCLLRYSRIQIGNANTLLGAHHGLATMRHRLTQSCPQLTSFLAQLEINGSWCIPAPNSSKPRLRHKVSSPARMITASGATKKIDKQLRQLFP